MLANDRSWMPGSLQIFIFRFGWWSYQNTKMIHNSLFTFIFINFRLACLALQNEKTEHMVMKIMQPIFGILVALTKKRTYKNDMKSTKITFYIFFSGTARILTRLPSNALQLSSGPKNPFLPAKEATRPQPRNLIKKICIKNSCLWITIKAGCEVFDKASWRNP